MARPKKAIPELYQLSGDGCWCANFNGKRVRFGRDEQAARAAYQKRLAQWLLRGPANGIPNPDQCTVAEALTAYYKHVRELGRMDWRVVARLEIAIEHTLQFCSDMPAADFDADTLDSLRQSLCRTPSSRDGQTLSRTYVNALVRSIRQAWRWIERKKLVPRGSAAHLRELAAMSAGDGARESAPRLPVSDDAVARTLPHCSPTLTAMIRVQRSSGCRPGELVAMTRERISTSPAERITPMPGLTITGFTDASTGVAIWVYCPVAWKQQHIGKPRQIVLGPAAQAALAPLIEGRDPTAPIFSPIESEAWRAQQLSSARKTKVQPSQKQRAAARRARARKKPPGIAYSVESYARAVKGAIERANKAETRAASLEGREPVLIPHWTPYQLRHAAASQASELGDEHLAAALLGDHPDTVRVYTVQAMRKAGAHAAKHG